MPNAKGELARTCLRQQACQRWTAQLGGGESEGKCGNTCVITIDLAVDSWGVEFGGSVPEILKNIAE